MLIKKLVATGDGAGFHDNIIICMETGFGSRSVGALGGSGLRIEEMGRKIKNETALIVLGQKKKKERKMCPH